MSETTRPPFLRRLWREWLRPLAAAIVVVGSLRTAVADWNDVPTGSMKPTILEGERIVVNKLAYDLKLPFTRVRLARWDEPRRGDVVVLFSPQDGKRLVKRIVGVPGDRLEARGGRLAVNGRPFAYEAADVATRDEIGALGDAHLVLTEWLGDRSHLVMHAPVPFAPRTFGPVVVPEDSYFVMGDNRDESFDSRFFGLVPRDAITGRAVAIAASVDPERHYLPRWQRFFRRLR